MSAECNSDVATNNNLNCCLLTQNWWLQDNIHHAISSSLSSCTTTRSSNYLWQQQSNHNQQSSESSSCDEDVVSISNTQNSATNLHQYQFLLGVDENSNSLITGETAASDHNHMIWSQLLLSSSTSGSAGSNTKNLFENNNEDAVSEISLLDGASNLSSKTCFDNQLGNNDHHDDYFHPYSNLLGRQLPLNYTQNSSMDPMFPTGSSHQYSNQENNNVHQVKLPRHNCGVLPEVDDNSTNLADFSISFGSYLTKPLVDPFNEFKPSLKTLNLCEHNSKHGLRASSAKAQGTIPTCNTRSNIGIEKQFPSEGKKRRSEDNSETFSKRQKNNESSAVSSAKIQVPKVKLADKITALQQIVSPFGKTDTASVLWETINYVRFLQEQIQLLSHAYMNSNTCKERWGGFDRKERGDLRSRGLCLVPISCTPQIYRESNNGSDYLIPAYRGCLYR